MAPRILPTRESSLKILVIEDDLSDYRLLCAQVASASKGVVFSHATSLAESFQTLSEEIADIVLLDLGLPDSDGLETFLALKERHPALPVILLTGSDDTELALQALEAGAQDFLTKGDVHGPSVMQSVRYALARASADQKVRDALQACADAIIVVGQDRRVRFANSAAASLFGCSPELLLSQSSVLPADGTEWVLPSGSIVETRCQALEWDETTATLYSFRDVTARRRAEAKYAQAQQRAIEGQKMESLGRLAGGIAHDFNNLIMGIMGQAELLKLGLDDSEVLSAAEVLLTASKRAASLTTQLLGFARQGKYQSVPVDLHKSVHEALALVTSTLNPNISVITEFEASNPKTKGDPTQLSQAFLNLILNAADAMPEGGELKIVSRSRAGSTSIEFQDTGVGIKPEIQGKIFEPFFTTKPIGQGTGMGLAMVHGVVHAHGGSLELSSWPDRGCRIELSFPTLESGGLQVKAAEQKTVSYQGTVLLIEDDELVSKVSVTLLERMGFHTLVADSGEKGLELFKANHHCLDLVMLDLRMPGMGGANCLQFMKELNVSVPVLVVTGFATRESALQADGWLRKPYTIEQLQEAISALYKQDFQFSSGQSFGAGTR